jgi:cell division protease FtsH
MATKRARAGTRRKNPFLDLKSKDKAGKDKKTRNFTFLYFVIAIVVILIINSYLSSPEVKTVSYSEFKQYLAAGKISDVTIGNDAVQGMLTENGT